MSISLANVTTAVGNTYVSTNDSAVTWCSLCNYSASNVTANIHVVPSGDTADTTNLVLIGLQLTAAGNATGDTYQLYSGGEKIILADGDAIAMSASANNAITVVTSYTSL